MASYLADSPCPGVMEGGLRAGHSPDRAQDCSIYARVLSLVVGKLVGSIDAGIGWTSEYPSARDMFPAP